MKTRFKRMVACVLALMLIVAAIPMSASAAAPTKVNITLKAVTFSDAVLNALSKTNASQRENLLRQALDMVGAETNEDASKLPEYAQKVNNMPQTLSGSGTEEDPYVVEKGTPFL